MSHIIVTAVDHSKKKAVDVELPTDVEISRLTEDLLISLMAMDSNLFWDSSSVALESRRLNRVLVPEKTLGEEGVLDGDYLLIVQK